MGVVHPPRSSVRDVAEGGDHARSCSLGGNSPAEFRRRSGPCRSVFGVASRPLDSSYAWRVCVGVGESRRLRRQHCDGIRYSRINARTRRHRGRGSPTGFEAGRGAAHGRQPRRWGADESPIEISPRTAQHVTPRARPASRIRRRAVDRMFPGTCRARQRAAIRRLQTASARSGYFAHGAQGVLCFQVSMGGAMSRSACLLSLYGFLPRDRTRV